MHIYIYIYICICAFTCTHTYIHAYVYIYIHISTYIWTLSSYGMAAPFSTTIAYVPSSYMDSMTPCPSARQGNCGNSLITLAGTPDQVGPCCWIATVKLGFPSTWTSKVPQLIISTLDCLYSAKILDPIPPIVSVMRYWAIILYYTRLYSLFWDIRPFFWHFWRSRYLWDHIAPLFLVTFCCLEPCNHKVGYPKRRCGMSLQAGCGWVC